MDSGNLFSAPQAQLLPEPAVIPEGSVANAVVDELVRLHRWLFVMSITGLATSATIVAYMVFLVVAQHGGGAEMVGAAVALLYVAPGVALLRTAQAIGRFGNEPTAVHLADVTGKLRDFWRLAGSVTAAALGVALFMTVFVRIFLRSM